MQIFHLGRDIANCDEFTLELFVKMNADNQCTWRDACSFIGYHKMKMCNPGLDNWGIQNLTLQNKGGDWTAMGCQARGNWRHVAVTCRKEDWKAKLYVGGEYAGQIHWTNNVGQAVTSGDFMLGSGIWGNSESMYGHLSCLRVSDRVLTRDEFMAAADEPLDVKREVETIGLWDFRDGEPWEKAGKLANRAISGAYDGMVWTTNGNGEAVADWAAAPRFSEDRPGDCLFAGVGGRRVAKDVQSLELPYTAGADRGVVKFPALARQLSLHDSFTLEVFAKVDPKFLGDGRWATLFSAMLGERVKVCAPGWNCRTVDLQKAPWTGNETARHASDTPLCTDSWRHYAMRYDGERKKMELWVDYAKAGEIDFDKAMTHRNEAVYVGALSKAGNPGYSVEQPFFGKLCGLRATARALGPEEFLRAAGSAETSGGVGDGATAHWTFEEGTPPYTFDWAFNRWDLPQGTAYRAEGWVENRGPKPQASREIDEGHPFVFSGNKLLHRNRRCAYFEGGRKTEGAESWSGPDEWKGDALRWAAATNAWRNPRNFTVELFARSTNEWINVNEWRQKLIMGSEGGGWMGDAGYWTSYVDGQKVYYATNWTRYTWRVMMERSGKVKLETYRHTFTDANGDGTNDNGRVSLSVGTLSGSDVNMLDGKWHHIAFTYDDASRTARVFYDYRPVIEQPHETELAHVDSRLDVGRGLDRSGFDGFMDEIRVTPRVLGVEEMLRMRSLDGLTIIFR